LLGDAKWPKVADAVIEAENLTHKFAILHFVTLPIGLQSLEP